VALQGLANADHAVFVGYSNTAHEFQLSDPDDRSSYMGINNQRDSVINPCLNSTYRFVELVISHLVSLHKVSLLNTNSHRRSFRGSLALIMDNIFFQNRIST